MGSVGGVSREERFSEKCKGKCFTGNYGKHDSFIQQQLLNLNSKTIKPLFFFFLTAVFPELQIMPSK